MALHRAVDGAVRRVDEILHVGGMPMVAARLACIAVHALLHDGPLAVIGDEEAVQVKVEAVLHGGAVDLGDEAAGARQRRRVEPQAVAKRAQLIGRLAGVAAAAAAHVDAELVLQRCQAALEGADDAGGNPGRMPVHAHHGAERLEPEGMRQAAEKFVAAVVVNDGLADDGAERGHARGQPRGHAPAVQG